MRTVAFTMADKYRYRTDDRAEPRRDPHDDPYAGHGQGAADRGDPLAELARLIGQEDPFAAQRPQRSTDPRDYEPAPQWLTSPADDPHDHESGYRRAGPAGRAPYYDEPAEPQSDDRRYDHGGYDQTDDYGGRTAGRQDYDYRYAEPHEADVARYSQTQDAYSEGYRHPDEPYAEPGAHTGYNDEYLRTAAADFTANHPAYAPEPAPDFDAGRRDIAYPGAAVRQQPAPAAHAYDAAAEESDYEAPPPRRRTGVVAVVVVAGLAILGTAGVFGYRAFVHSSGGKAPVIMADTGPNKVVPATQPGEGSSASKLIYDRVADKGQNERVVSREEQPVDVKPPRIVLPGGPAVQVQQPPPWNVGGDQGASNASVPASAVSGGASNNEPKRVRTTSIRPDQRAEADAARPSGPVRSAAIGPTPVPASENATAPRPARTVAPSQAAAPLSIAPQAQPDTPPPARTAALPPPRAASPAPASEGGYMVQLTSQKSQTEAQSSFRALQTRYPAVLGNREPVIKRADLGSKGIYYRAQVGPFSTSDQANEFCSSLRAAGGQCIIQRN